MERRSSRFTVLNIIMTDYAKLAGTLLFTKSKLQKFWWFSFTGIANDHLEKNIISFFLFAGELMTNYSADIFLILRVGKFISIEVLQQLQIFRFI